ncbi:MAG: AI-2E family transporter [Cellulosilyticaceae bacterium]
MDKSRLKLYLSTATYSILFYLILTNLSSISNTFDNLFTLLNPFIYGFIIAYLLNGPYVFLYNKVYTLKNLAHNSKLQRIRKPLSLISVYVLFLLIITIIFSIIVPQLVESINTLISSLPQYSKSLELFINNTLDSLNLPYNFWNQFQALWRDLLQTIGKFVTTGLPRILDIAMNITTSISSIVIGFVVSIYMLSGKDKLKAQVKKLLFAFLPEKHVLNILNIAALTNRTFGGFITGQLTDAFILGILCFIGMSIFSFPYTLLISVIIGITNIIPIFGPIIGGIPCTFIILMANPIKALWFIVFIFVLQQIDGNIICPKIVGNSIGLSGLWVIFAILVGGGLLGLFGMVIGVPTFAVIYALVKHVTYVRLNKKKVLLKNLVDVETE